MPGHENSHAMCDLRDDLEIETIFSELRSVGFKSRIKNDIKDQCFGTVGLVPSVSCRKICINYQMMKGPTVFYAFLSSGYLVC